MNEQAIFKAIGDPTRRGIMALLVNGDLTVTEIASNFDMTRPAVAKHLGILCQGGLVKVTPRGRERIHSLRPETLKTVAEWLSFYSQFWDDKLDKLKLAVEADHD